MTDVVLCIDGLDPAYVEATETPNWDRIADHGNAGVCKAAIPSLTNVNNLSIITSSFPEEHGITGSTYYDEEREEVVYMEIPEYVLCDTILETEARAGKTVGAVVAKRKLKRMMGDGLDVSVAAEDKPESLERAVGETPGMYDQEDGGISRWVIDAAIHVIDDLSPDLLYVSTTDVIPHKNAPEDDPAKDWVRAIDDRLGELFDRGCRIVATADHGMNAKSFSVNIKALLEDEGYPAEVFGHGDRHTYHHQSLAGNEFIYLYEHDAEEIDWLASVEGVDEFLTAEEAATRFRLGEEHIGDALVLGTEDSAFGGMDAAPDLRTHGSLYEQDVPYLSTEDAKLEHSKDVFTVL